MKNKSEKKIINLDSPQETKVSKPNNSTTGNIERGVVSLHTLSVPRCQKDLKDSKMTNSVSLLRTDITDKNDITDITDKNDTTFILDNPVKKTEIIYYYLYNNGESITENIIKFAEITKDNFYHIKGRDKNIQKIKTNNKTAYYNITEELRKEIQFKIYQKIESLERIEQNKADAEIRAKEENATEEELLIRAKEIIDDKFVFLLDDGEAKFNLKELKELYPKIFEFLIEKPEEARQLLEIAVVEKDLGDIPIRFTNLIAINNLPIENYRSKHLGKAVCSEAMITKMTAVRSLVTSAKFECPSCGTIISVLQLDKKFKEPSRCSCGRRGGFKEIAKDMVDGCILKAEDIQSKNNLPIPKDIVCYAKGKLLKPSEISKLSPGNNIRLFGVFKEIAVEKAGGGILTRFDWAVDIIDIEEFDPELNSTDFTKEEEEAFQKFSLKIDKGGLDILIESYAPELEGFNIEKKALAIQSVQMKNKPGETKTKGDILIMSGPGEGKSVLAKRAIKLTHGSSISSGGGASGVGLTAAIVKEDQLGWGLKPGRLPLTPELVVIDEYNLLSCEEKPLLQEAQSENRITIDKAGIHATLKVSCGILALANPVRGVFDTNQPIIKQFDLTPPQLNRFDAVFVLRDDISREKDDRITDIMLKRQRGEIISKYDTSFLRKFFTYIRNRQEPELTKEAEESLKNSYKKARQATKDNNSILLNARFFESLCRFATGYAKLRGSKTILKKDTEEAYNILSKTYLNLSEVSKI